jgi:hypothetical protein
MLLLIAAAPARAQRKREVTPGERLMVPLVVYDDCDNERRIPFRPSGWMGDVDAIKREECWKKNPHSGTTCIRIACAPSRQWYGIVWHAIPGDWGDLPGGYDLSGARKVTFWARGERGGEEIEFNACVLNDERKPYPDSARGKPKRIELEQEWKQYRIYIIGDKRCIKTGFSWSARGSEEETVFYLDDIRFEG